MMEQAAKFRLVIAKRKEKNLGVKDAPWDTTIVSPKYRSISNITLWLTRFYIAIMIMTVISVVTTFILPFLSTSNEAISEKIYNLMDIPYLIMGVPAFILFILWYFRANKNIHAFGAKGVTSPIMSVIWWFVPIANLWKPYYVTQEIWKASNPEVKLFEGIEWKNHPSSKLIKQWWILALSSIVVSVLFGIFVGSTFSTQLDTRPEQSINVTLLGNVLAIPFLVVGIILTILFIKILEQISNWQEIKSSERGHRSGKKGSKSLLIIFILAIVASVASIYLTYVSLPDPTFVNTELMDLNDKGDSLYALGQYQDAITWYDKALEINPSDIATLIDKGDSLYALGQYQDAITWYDKALEINPSELDVLYYKGNSLYALGQYKEAIIWYDKALVIEPDNEDILKYKNAAINQLS